MCACIVFLSLIDIIGISSLQALCSVVLCVWGGCAWNYDGEWTVCNF